MAYSYDSINELLGNGAQPLGQNQGEGAAGPNNPTGNANYSTDTGGLGGRSGSGSAGSTGAGGSSTASGGNIANVGVNPTTGSQAAFQANAGNTNAPTALNTIGAGITNTQSGLANAATNYLSQQAQAYNPAISSDNIANYVQNNDTTGLSSIRNLLNQSAAPTVSSFTPGSSTVAGANLLGTQSGIGQLLSQQNGPTFTPQMAQFDAGLLAASPTFNNQVGGLINSNQNLQNYASGLGASTTQQAQSSANQALTGAQGAATNDLGNLGSGITKAESDAAAAANAALPGEIAAQLPGASNALIQQVLAQINPSLTQSFQGTGTNLATGLGNLASSAPGEANNYINQLAPNSYTAADFVSPEQAQQYNIISGLLGLTGDTQTASGPLKQALTTNPTAFANALLTQGQQGISGLNSTSQNNINNIINQLTQQANTDTSNAQNAYNNYGQTVTSSLQNLIKSLPAAQQAQYTPSVISNLVNSYTSSNKAPTPTAVTYQDLINSQQAQELNNYENQIYAKPNTTYKAGSYNPYSANVNTSALQALLNGVNSAPGQSTKTSANNGIGNIASTLVNYATNFVPFIGSYNGMDGTETLGQVATGQKPTYDNPLLNIPNPITPLIGNYTPQIAKSLGIKSL